MCTDEGSDARGWRRHAAAGAFAALLGLTGPPAPAAGAAERSPLLGVYIVSGAFARGWSEAAAAPDVLATPDTLAAALAQSIADIRRLGFNTLILDPGFYAGRSFGYETYSGIAAEQAEHGGVGIVLGLPISCPAVHPRCWDDARKRNDAYLDSCRDGRNQRAFVDRFADRPAVTGFLCAYENFGQPNVTAVSLAAVHRLTRYIERKGKIYFDIPAAGLQDRIAGVFTLITPQLNPRLHATPARMRAEIAADAARYSGAEINFWHSQTTSQNGYPSGPTGTGKWHQLQYDAFIGVRPRNVTVFDYQKLIAEHDGALDFYRPRGWLMSLLTRLGEPSLTFFDPLESEFSSAVLHAEPFDVVYGYDGLDTFLGHRIDGGVATITRDGGLSVPLAIPDQGGAPLVSLVAGTFSAWIKADWPVGSDAEHGLLRMPCLADGRDCLTVEIVNGDFGLILTDAARRQVIAMARLGECGRRSEWSHLAATWALAAGRLALYCDGHAIASVDESWEDKPLPPRPATDRLIIGNLAGPGGKAGAHGLAGELDEVRLYSRALPPDQILQLYQSLKHAAAHRVHSTP
jgi:hypothetical protein